MNKKKKELESKTEEKCKNKEKVSTRAKYENKIDRFVVRKELHVERKI